MSETSTSGAGLRTNVRKSPRYLVTIAADRLTSVGQNCIYSSEE